MLCKISGHAFCFSHKRSLLLLKLCLISAYVEQVASCVREPPYSATFRTYAHSQFNRVLVSEIHADRDNDSQIILDVMDLSGVESTDMIWEAPEQIDEDTV